MDIKYFEKIRLYRKNGHPALVLKLVLPKIYEEETSSFGELFNKFYTEIISSYEKAAAHWTKKKESVDGERPTLSRLEVFCADVTEAYKGKYSKRKEKGELLVIERRLSLSARGDKLEKKTIDIFDTGRGFMLH